MLEGEGKGARGGGTWWEAVELHTPPWHQLQLSQAMEPMVRCADYMNEGHPPHRLRPEPHSSFFKKNFYWGIIDSQCCISIRCTEKCIC